jgi:hypothetical protein
MKLSTLAMLGGAVLATGGLIVIGLEKGGDVATTADSVRAVRLDGECPKPSKDAPACQSMKQEKGYCVCLTTQKVGVVDGEVSSASIAARPAKDVQRLVVCPGVDRNPPSVKWQTKDKPLDHGCLVAADDVVIPNLSMTGLETDVEAKLRAFCAPCPVSAGHWGLCPSAAFLDGGFAKACPVQPEAPPK